MKGRAPAPSYKLLGQSHVLSGMSQLEVVRPLARGVEFKSEMNLSDGYHTDRVDSPGRATAPRTEVADG